MLHNNCDPVQNGTVTKLGEIMRNLFLSLFLIFSSVVANANVQVEQDTVKKLLAQSYFDTYEQKAVAKGDRFSISMNFCGIPEGLSLQTVTYKWNSIQGRYVAVTSYIPYIFTLNQIQRDMNEKPSVEGNKYLLATENSVGGNQTRVYIEIHPQNANMIRVTFHYGVDIKVGANGAFTSSNYTGQGIAMTTPWFELNK